MPIQIMSKHKNIATYTLENNQPFFFRGAAIVKTPRITEIKYPLICENNSMCYSLGDFANYTETYQITENIIKGTITLNVLTNSPFNVQIPFTFPKLPIEPYFQIPNFLLGNNTEKPKLNNQFLYGTKLLIAANESKPSSIITIYNGMVNAVMINPKMEFISEQTHNYIGNGLLIDTTNEFVDTIGFTLGMFNSVTQNQTENNEANFICNCKGKTLQTSIIYYANWAPEGIGACNKAIEEMVNCKL